MTRIRLGLLAVLLPALLAGCADDPEPKMPDPTSAAATPTTSPSPTGPVEPTFPPEAEGDDKKAAIAFAGYYFDVLNYMSETGDAGALRDVTAATCSGCFRAADVVETIYGNGGKITGGEYTVKSVRAYPLSTDGNSVDAYEMTVVATNTDQVVSGAGKKFDGDYPQDKATHTLAFQPMDAGWVVNKWEISR